MEDQPADPGDLTTGPAGQNQPAKPRRRWFRLRRKAKSAEPTDDSGVEPETEPQAEPVKPTPVGKARRAAKAASPADEAPVEEHDEEAVGEAQVEAPETQPVNEAPPAEGKEAADDADDADDVDEVGDEAQAPEEVLVPHRPASRRALVAVLVAAVLFVAAAAFAGATLQPYLADRAAVDTKLKVARTAADAISTLWTYTPDDMESLPDRSAAYLGGDFAEEYRKYIDAIVPTNKQAQVTNTTSVMGAAVESLSPTEATALVYTNSVATSPLTKNIPSLRYLSYRLTMKRDDTKWLITRMSTVTSFDLTPQL